MDPKQIDDLSRTVAFKPRVSLDEINDAIISVAYLKGDEFLAHAERVSKNPNPPTLYAAHLTICMVSLKNGWIVLGKAAPVSPENYNQEIGRKFAYDDAVKQIWPLMGFALRDRLTSE